MRTTVGVLVLLALLLPASTASADHNWGHRLEWQSDTAAGAQTWPANQLEPDPRGVDFPGQPDGMPVLNPCPSNPARCLVNIIIAIYEFVFGDLLGLCPGFWSDAAPDAAYVLAYDSQAPGYGVAVVSGQSADGRYQSTGFHTQAGCPGG